MPKFAQPRVVTLKQSRRTPWLWSCRFPYHHRLKEEIKAIPGVEWNAASKCWMVPEELVAWVATKAQRYGYAAEQIALHRAEEGYEPPREILDGLYEYQVEAVKKALKKPSPTRPPPPERSRVLPFFPGRSTSFSRC